MIYHSPYSILQLATEDDISSLVQVIRKHYILRTCNKWQFVGSGIFFKDTATDI